MSETPNPEPDPGENQRGSASPTSGRRTGPGRAAVLIPAATFLIGLALGWALVAVSQTDDTETEAEPVPEASESPTTGPEAGDVVVTIPAACEQSAENLREAASLLRESVGQVRDFDPDRLVDTLNRLETIDEETRPLIEECSGASITRSASPTG